MSIDVKTESAATDLTLSVDGAKLFLEFVRNSLRRNRRLAVVTGASTCALAVLALLIMPPTYRVQSRVLTHMSYIIPALASPTRSIPWQAQTATTGAVELIKARDNLSGIIDELDLVKVWEETRSPMGRFLDSLRAFAFGELGDDDVKHALINVLDRSLFAHLEDGNIIVMTIEWHHPESALRILETAQQRFLDNRRNTELSEINETVNILEKNVADSKPLVDAAAERLRSVVTSTSAGRRLSRPDSGGTTPSAAPTSLADLQAATSMENDLRQKRETISRMEHAYKERVRNAESALAALRTHLGPNHPDVVNAVRNLEIASRAPDELAQLKGDEAKLSLQLGKQNPSSGRSTPTATSIIRSVAPALNSMDPEVQQALAEFERADSSLADQQARLDGARIEVLTAKAAFSYRYIVTQPPILPRKAVRPRTPVILGGGLLAALLLAVAAAIGADVVSGRIVESWQIARFSGVPVLGEIEES